MTQRRSAAVTLTAAVLVLLAVPPVARGTQTPGRATPVPPGTRLAPGHVEISAHRLSQRMTFELRPAADAKQIHLRVDAHLRAGSVHWLLTDPDGETVFDAHGDGRDIAADSGTMTCDPTCEVSAGSLPGVWTLTLTLADATGTCSIRYEGLEPVPPEPPPTNGH